MLTDETTTKFVGCVPYAHDALLGTRREKPMQPKAAFDFASLGYTWYHVARGVMDWKFEGWEFVSEDELNGRRKHMENFLEHDIGDEGARLVPRVYEVFAKSDSGKKRPRGIVS